MNSAVCVAVPVSTAVINNAYSYTFSTTPYDFMACTGKISPYKIWDSHSSVDKDSFCEGCNDILLNNQQMSQCAVKFYFSASPLYMFRAAHTPIIRSIETCRVDLQRNKTSLYIVTSVGYSIEYYDARNNKYQVGSYLLQQHVYVTDNLCTDKQR